MTPLLTRGLLHRKCATLDRQIDGLMTLKLLSLRKSRPGVVFDYNEQNQVVGVEILGISKRSPGLNPRELQFQTV